jgi:predicted nucleic acid-binding protein
LKSSRVFVDTNVLFPASLADLTLSTAEYGLFELVYSDHLLEEIKRVLVDQKGLAPANAQRFIDEICETFPDGRIASAIYQSTAESWTGPDRADLIHLAAAACAGAAVLVTNNTKDFKPAVPPVGVIKPTIVTADEFFCSLLDEGFQDDIVNVVNAMISANRRPPQTWDAMMQRLTTVGLSRFVGRLVAVAKLAT